MAVGEGTVGADGRAGPVTVVVVVVVVGVVKAPFLEEYKAAVAAAPAAAPPAAMIANVTFDMVDRERRKMAVCGHGCKVTAFL